MLKSIEKEKRLVDLIQLIDEGKLIIPLSKDCFRWDKETSSKFIESLILGFPVTEIYTWQQCENQEVLDGCQRLLTLYFFVKNRFLMMRKRVFLNDYLNDFYYPVNSLDQLLEKHELFEKFSLQGLSFSDKLNGCGYSGLDGGFKNNLDFAKIRIVNIIPKSTIYKMLN